MKFMAFNKTQVIGVYRLIVCQKAIKLGIFLLVKMLSTDLNARVFDLVVSIALLKLSPAFWQDDTRCHGKRLTLVT